MVVALLINGQKNTSSFTNDHAGHKQLYKWAVGKVGSNKVLACAESTGKYSEKIAEYLYSKNYDVSIVNPYCIKAYANSKLARHKNDQVDALIIAEYARLHDVPLYKPRDPKIQEIRNLYRCLEDLKIMRIQITNHFENKESLPKAVNDTWKLMLHRIDKQMITIEEKILQIIESDDNFKKDYENLQSVIGISKTTAIAVIAEVPDIKSFRSARQLAAYAGLTPKHRTSGTSLRGKSRISKVGSCNLRKALYFPAIVAKKHNPVIKEFCEKLKRKGKHVMAIICAAMRKLVHIIYGILKHRTAFNKELVPAV